MATAAGSIALKILKLVFLFVDIILFLVPLLMTLSRKKKLREYSIVTEAVIVEMNSHAMNSMRRTAHVATPMWFPTYQYMINGQTYTKPSQAGTTTKHYEVGDRVKILVDPNNFNNFTLPDNPGFKLATGILWAMAAFFFIASVIVFTVVK